MYGVSAGVFFVIVAELYLSRPCCAQEEQFNKNQNKFILNSIHGILLYGLGAISTLLITEVGKHTIGRLRPHFIDVCKPKWDEISCFTKISEVPVAKYVRGDAKLCFNIFKDLLLIFLKLYSIPPRHL